MVNQQKRRNCAVVVNVHNMYSHPYIVFDPKGVIETWKNDIGRDGDTRDHTTAL